LGNIAAELVGRSQLAMSGDELEELPVMMRWRDAREYKVGDGVAE
jgi:hypothetical protein